jgi:diacylglycerol kinase family enzyme
MQADIIYNEGAGGNNGPTVEALEAAFREIGIQATGHVTSSVDEIDPILEGAKDLIVAAGGDGTIAAVLTRLIDKKIPLSILPMGTANNIAASFGLPRDPLKNIAMLKKARHVYYDVGHMNAPWGVDYFFEGAGFGYFGDILATYDPEKGKSIWRGVEAISNHLLNGKPYFNCLKVNGEEINGEFLLVEVMNAPTIGPRLKLAPNAISTDGYLNLVYIRAGDRKGLLDYFASMLLEDLDRLETVTERPIQEVSFHWDGFPVHIDGEVRPPNWKEREIVEETEFGSRPDLPEPEVGNITVKVIPGAVTLWLPVTDKE